MKKIILSLAMAAAIVSCNSSKTVDDPLAESGRTQRTENLLANLREISANGYLVGHQDDPVYGVGWVGDSCRSDVKSVCNDYPAVIGFDLGHLELGDSLNLDGVPFDRMKQEIIRQYDRGGMVTLSWHLDNPLTGGSAWVKPDSLTDQEKQTVASVLEGGECHDKFLGWLDTLASFLNSLETSYGVKVPVLFRPWHEHTGSWFWWGQNLCTTEQYKALWKYMFNYLKAEGFDNLIWVWTSQTGDDNWYPGDAYVDIVGRDLYGDNAASCANNYTTLFNKYSNKIVTLSECGWSEYTNSRVANISEQWESGAKWSWFMPWYDGSDAVNKHADEAWWKAAMELDYVITRDKVKF